MYVELNTLEYIKSLGYGVTLCFDDVRYFTYNGASLRWFRNNYVLFDLETGEILACIPVLRFVGDGCKKRYLDDVVWRFREIARFFAGINRNNNDLSTNLECLQCRAIMKQ